MRLNVPFIYKLQSIDLFNSEIVQSQNKQYTVKCTNSLK